MNFNKTILFLTKLFKIKRLFQNSKLKQLKISVKNYFYKIKFKNKTKYFCIGFNKTGTTSLEKAFKDLGFIVGDQVQAEFLLEHCLNEDYSSLIEFCKTAEVYQDIPFSLSNTYKIVDKAFPKSKFILTIRDDSEQWYNSITNFHSKFFGKGKIPSWDDLKNANYVYKGWIYKYITGQYNLTEDDPSYDKEKLIAQYDKHNKEVIDYFENRNKDLLVINLSDDNAFIKFTEFIGVETKAGSFPWVNKTNQMNIK